MDTVAPMATEHTGDVKENEDIALEKPAHEWVSVGHPVFQAEVLEEHLARDIVDTSNASYFWRKVGNGSEAVAKILVIGQGVISFGAAMFDMPLLSFASGAISVVAVGLYGFSSYSMSESKERTEQMNMILKYKGVPVVPNIAVDSTKN